MHFFKLFTFSFTLTCSLFWIIYSVAAAPESENCEFASKDNLNQALSLKAFEYVHQVAIHKRCTNCHSSAEQPLQGPLSKFHSMKVSRNIERVGQKCTTCHRNTNGDLLHSPPGAEHWAMPSLQKSISAKTSAKELCRIWSGPSNGFELGQENNCNGFRTGKDIVAHVASDPLIKWAWKPGKGRTKPPGLHEDFVRAVDDWVKYGAYCPQ